MTLARPAIAPRQVKPAAPFPGWISARHGTGRDPDNLKVLPHRCPVQRVPAGTVNRANASGVSEGTPDRQSVEPRSIDGTK